MSQSQKQSGSTDQGSNDTATGRPQVGNRLTCLQCGFELEVKTECQCEPDCQPQFTCCGEPLGISVGPAA